MTGTNVSPTVLLFTGALFYFEFKHTIDRTYLSIISRILPPPKVFPILQKSSDDQYLIFLYFSISSISKKKTLRALFGHSVTDCFAFLPKKLYTSPNVNNYWVLSY